MIFEARPLTDIDDTEILSLVSNHVRERQHIEYKVTVNLKEDESKFEALCDIASLANGGGGYLVIGIRDDGAGRAQKFDPGLVGDIERIRQVLRSLC
ncbi:MAG: putative DNA binding domain-containing protein, partial [Bdellovibrionales bacterium]|nr:putative DNA binding domain-containing protein [Bdellovibrionales bacterium]